MNRRSVNIVDRVVRGLNRLSSSKASLDSGGKVPVSELGTGTADSSKFLRGDRTWAAGGGGVTDHAQLTGLDEDDHSLYALADGTRGDFEVEGAVAAHTAAGDPHPAYTTAAELASELGAHEGAADPHAGYQLESQKGAANGYVSLDAGATIPDTQIPAGIARDAEVAAAIATHAGLSDPHPGYALDTDLSAHVAAADPHIGYQRESEKGVADGYAALDGTTRVPVAQLGSGTPTGALFLRDDRTWAAPAGGGGGPATTKKTADEATTSNTVLTSAAGLNFALTSGRYYTFEFRVLFRTAATTTGIVLSVSIPAVTRFGATVETPFAADGAGGQFQGWVTASNDVVIATGVQAANTDYLAFIRGVILPSADGALQVRFRSEVNGSAVTVRQCSVGVLFDLGA